MAALKKLELVARAVADFARVHLGSAFKCDGITFQHPGVLLDQEGVAEVVAKVRSILAKRTHAPSEIRYLFSRIHVRFLPPEPPAAARVDLRAIWSGGFRDRGLISMRKSEDWPERLGRSLLALTLLELEPEGHPDDREDFHVDL